MANKKKMSNKMKMVKDPKTGKMVPEFAVKKAARRWRIRRRR